MKMTELSVDQVDNVNQTVTHLPSQGQFVEMLTQIGVVEGLLLCACGIVFLIYGWKLFKTLVIADSAVLGAFLGYTLGMHLRGENTYLYCAIAGGLLLGALAWPLMKYAVSLMGGLAGAFMGFGLWHYLTEAFNKPALAEYSWVGALVGLITLGLLAFIIFKATIMTVTSVQGSLMIVSGTLSLLLKHGGFEPRLHSALVNNHHLLPLLILVPAVIGFALQHTTAGGKPKKPG